MGKESYHKVYNEDKLKLLNELLIDVERKKKDMATDEFIKMSSESQSKYIKSVRDGMKEIEELNKVINELISYAPEISNKIYLTEVIDIEKPEFSSNNLIISPVGSGKTTLITDRLIEDKEQTVLMLVSNNGLKDSLAPDSNDARKELGNRMFSTSNKEVYGSERYKIHVMTYAEFGDKIYINDDFLKDNKIEYIFCDEIHSLPDYINYGSKSNGGLIHAQRFVFSKHENIEIYYFTATDSNLLQAERNRKGTLSNIKVFDYSDYPNIMRYMPKAVREISNIEQIRQYLKDRRVGFQYYSYKGIAFSKTISSLKRIEEIVIEEGYTPLVLWSNKNEDYEMTEEQLSSRDELLRTNKIPKQYDFLIYNSSLQEGWDLKDKSVKLAIMNTTNETDYIQALGRLRRDVDLLVYRSKDKYINLSETAMVIPEDYLNRSLTAEDKGELIGKLGIVGNLGKLVTWRTIKKTIDSNNIYKVEDYRETIDGERVRVSKITRVDSIQ